MSITVLKGTIVSAPHFGELDITENGFLVAEDGRITGVFSQLPERYAAAPVEDFGDALILQSFADLHLHAPQYPMLGTGMDLPLLDWLNTYTFPTEARFADPDYARETYRKLARELISLGTTRVCMFSSLHTDATLILMEELEAAGVTGYVGKVNMDRNAAPGVLEETTEESMAETLRWLEACKDFKYVKPMLTPRFTPSCTDELMAFLGKLAAERNLPIQSHLSENDKEIEWVRELHPDCRQYWETYAKFGLWNDRTVMAHCVWSDERERRAMLDAGVTVVHRVSIGNLRHETVYRVGLIRGERRKSILILCRGQVYRLMHKLPGQGLIFQSGSRGRIIHKPMYAWFESKAFDLPEGEGEGVLVVEPFPAVIAEQIADEEECFWELGIGSRSFGYTVHSQNSFLHLLERM